MYYSLAIVLDRDITNGSFWPSYVLCAANTTSEKRSGWRVIKQFGGKTKFTLPKVLVTSIYGHEDMLNYLSDYRTQDKVRGKHYMPSGALCWFETNRYGDPTGNVYYARKIPDINYLSLPREQRNYKKILAKQRKPLNKVLSQGRVDEEQWFYDFKKRKDDNVGFKKNNRRNKARTTKRHDP